VDRQTVALKVLAHFTPGRKVLDVVAPEELANVVNQVS
jgi:hypothetical protein